MLMMLGDCAAIEMLRLLLILKQGPAIGRSNSMALAGLVYCSRVSVYIMYYMVSMMLCLELSDTGNGA